MLNHPLFIQFMTPVHGVVSPTLMLGPFTSNNKHRKFLINMPWALSSWVIIYYLKLKISVTQQRYQGLHKKIETKKDSFKIYRDILVRILSITWFYNISCRPPKQHLETGGYFINLKDSISVSTNSIAFLTIVLTPFDFLTCAFCLCHFSFPVYLQMQEQ